MIAGDVGVSNRMGEAERLGFQLQSEEAEREMEGKRLHSERFHAEFLRFLGEVGRIVLARQQERQRDGRRVVNTQRRVQRYRKRRNRHVDEDKLAGWLRGNRQQQRFYPSKRGNGETFTVDEDGGIAGKHEMAVFFAFFGEFRCAGIAGAPRFFVSNKAETVEMGDGNDGLRVGMR